MEFCKNKVIKELDLDVFDIGKMYYIDMRCESVFLKGVFLCYNKKQETNEIEFALIITFEETTIFRSVTIGNEDVRYIREIKEVEVDTEHDLDDEEFPKWRSAHLYIDLSK